MAQGDAARPMARHVVTSGRPTRPLLLASSFLATAGPGVIGCGRRTTYASGDMVAGRSRASSHPDFHRRSRNFTRSTGRWTRPGRGLSPPVRNYTDPGARCSAYQCAMRRKVGVTLTTPTVSKRLLGRVTPGRTERSGPGPSSRKRSPWSGAVNRATPGRRVNKALPLGPRPVPGRRPSRPIWRLVDKRGDSVMAVSWLCHRIVTIPIVRIGHAVLRHHRRSIGPGTQPD
jgi:hypothetical protein